jgi:hypothetical protein
MQQDGLDTAPWFRQFWPWFIIALPSAAVIASFTTLWIAIGAAPERIDNFGAMAVPVEMTLDRKILIFDFGPRADGAWPAFLNVTLVSQADGGTQRLRAERFEERYFETPVSRLTPGAHEVIVENEDLTLRLRGSWAYPAPVWKLRVDD